MVEHKLVSFAAVVALWTLATLLIKLIRLLLKWKYVQGKNYAILAAMLRKRSYFIQVTRAGVFIWENFHPGYRDLGRKTRDLGNQTSLASHMNTSKWKKERKRSKARSRKPSQPGWLGLYEEALSLDLSKKNRAVPAVCVIVALLVDLLNDQVTSLQRKGITANLHWLFYWLYRVESGCRSMKDFWEQQFYSLPFVATSILNIIWSRELYRIKVLPD